MESKVAVQKRHKAYELFMVKLVRESWGVRVRTGCCLLRMLSCDWVYEQGNEYTASIKTKTKKKNLTAEKLCTFQRLCYLINLGS
jgi:hypothetical protein